MHSVVRVALCTLFGMLGVQSCTDDSSPSADDGGEHAAEDAGDDEDDGGEVPCADRLTEADCDLEECRPIMGTSVEDGRVATHYVGCGGDGLACTALLTCATDPDGRIFRLTMGGPGCIPKGWTDVGQNDACEELVEAIKAAQ